MEDAVAHHPVELEVAAEFLAVDGELRRPAALRPVGPVGGADLGGAFVRVVAGLLRGQVGDALVLALGIGHGGRREIGDQLLRRRGVTGGFVGDDVVGVGVVAEQAGAFGSQADLLQQHRPVVVALAGAAGDGGGVDAGTGVGRLQVGEHRLHAGQIQRDQPAGVATGLAGVAGEVVLRRLRQARQLGLVGDGHGPFVGVGQKVLAESGRQLRQPGVDLLQARLALVVEIRAGAPEIADDLVQQTAGFVVEFGHLAGPGVRAGRCGRRAVVKLRDSLDAAPQPFVQPDPVHVGGQFRRDDGLDGQALVGGVGAGDVEEIRGHPLQQAAGRLQRLEGVGERRLFGIGHDRRDLGIVVDERGAESGDDVLVADRGEVGQPVRQRRRREQRIVGCRAGCGAGGGAGVGGLGGRCVHGHPP